MEKPSKSAAELKALINHAISDLEITPDEFQRSWSMHTRMATSTRKSRCCCPSSTR